MADTIARAVEALEYYDVTYETTPTDTVIEAATLEELFAAVRAAHEAIADERRVVTELEIDYQPGRPPGMDARVRAVERELGRPPRSEPAPGDRRGRAPTRHEGGQRGPQHHERQVPARMDSGGGTRSPSGGSRRYGTRRR